MTSTSSALEARGLWVVVALLWLAVPAVARQDDTEADLLPRIQREHNPVKKAKYEIRLGRVKLDQAIEAYDHDESEQGRKLLEECLHWMKDSWTELKGSGRDAARKPQGFRELDIALREDGRLLEDVRHRVPDADREPLDRAAQELERIHNEVLAALFPAAQPRALERKGSKVQFYSIEGSRLK